VTIPSISTSATTTAPATGSLTYVSAMFTAGVPFQGNGTCSFWFSAGTQEGIGPGKVWVTFTCSGLTDPGTASTCGVSESYLVFENCQTH
jgi:hypothetical protein